MFAFLLSMLTESLGLTKFRYGGDKTWHRLQADKVWWWQNLGPTKFEANKIWCWRNWGAVKFDDNKIHGQQSLGPI